MLSRSGSFYGGFPGHRPSSGEFFLAPRMRSKEAGEGTKTLDLLQGETTAQEALWGVIITMGVTAMREGVMSDSDVEKYVLHFFCFWGPVSASINYSARFNDDDAFHVLLWTSFALGMAGQVAYLYHDLRGFAASTGFLYLVIALAHLRVLIFLPRARWCCAFFATINGAALSIFGVLVAMTDQLNWSQEKWALRAHAILEPVSLMLLSLLTWGRRQSCSIVSRIDNIPLSVQYMVGRHVGLHMMMLVCSILFPLGLTGSLFCSSARAASIILLAVLYALLLKLSLVDTHLSQDGMPCENGQISPRIGAPPVPERHALLWSSLTARMFLLVCPLSLLGIALTGVGFVMAAQDVDASFATGLVCWGSTLTWYTLTICKALNKPSDIVSHVSKFLAFLVTSSAFLVPVIVNASSFATVLWVTGLMGLMLALQVGLQIAKLKHVPRHWKWRRPRHLPVGSETGSFSPIGHFVSSQEHFFTVLVAVCVLRLNMNLQRSHDLELYFLRFMVFYGVLWASMRYASRFGDDDGSHKLLWCFFSLGFLLMLEGLATNDGDAREDIDHLRVAAAGTYVFLCFGCAVRIAVNVPNARVNAVFVAALHMLCAVLLFGSIFDNSRLSLWAYTILTVGADPIFQMLSFLCNRHSWDVPMNVEYIVARFNQLHMEVLGVAVIVPTAIYPGRFPHPHLVFIGDVLAVMLAVLLKIGLFDVEPVSFDRHAMRRSKVTALVFLSINITTILGICMVGVGMPLLIASSGERGNVGNSLFAQRITCGASCVFWCSQAVTKLLHAPKKHPRIHNAKVFVQAIGAFLGLVPVFLPLVYDFGTIVIVVCCNAFIVGSEMILNLPLWQPSAAPCDSPDSSPPRFSFTETTMIFSAQISLSAESSLSTVFRQTSSV